MSASSFDFAEPGPMAPNPRTAFSSTVGESLLTPSSRNEDEVCRVSSSSTWLFDSCGRPPAAVALEHVTSDIKCFVTYPVQFPEVSVPHSPGCWPRVHSRARCPCWKVPTQLARRFGHQNPVRPSNSAPFPTRSHLQHCDSTAGTDRRYSPAEPALQVMRLPGCRIEMRSGFLLVTEMKLG